MDLFTDIVAALFALVVADQVALALGLDVVEAAESLIERRG